ncbi:MULTISPECIES: FAD-dependent oxidoreductase [unclassified Streptomyces]|uniref:FAD-dependent oxidoreductase n=1 Tax=unclassified Streptomyces TaxID=2593676 RepID=UPI0036E6C9BD
MTPAHIVVIGNGMAGHRVAEEIHRRDADLRITVVGGEPRHAYNRVLLTNLLAGRATEESIGLPALPSGVRVLTGRAAVALDRPRRTVTLDGGDVLTYDRLVLATGSSPFVPPLKRIVRDDGGLVPGVVPFRTLDDCRRILRLAVPGARALVLGGGLLGVEAARGLAERGLDVTVLHAAPHLMERQLDGPAARVLAHTLGGLGIDVLTGIDVVGGQHGARFTGVELADGRTVPGDLLVVACGTRPDIALARSAGLATRRGVLVDAWMRTDDPALYAVGDCAEHAGTVSGLVASAWDQARTAAAALTGDPEGRPYRPAPPVARLKAAGIDLAALGDPDSGDEPDPGREVVTFTDSRRGVYQRIVLRDDRVTGAVLLGDTATAGIVTRLFDRRETAPRDRRLLLFPELADTAGTPAGGPAALPDDAVVCQCNGVTKGTLLRCRADGAPDLAAVARRTRATTGCGGCTSDVEELLRPSAAADPAGP